MKLSESTYTVGENGELRIPSDILKAMGLWAGDTVHLAFLTPDGEKNEFREFAVSGESLTEMPDGGFEQIGIPTQLLEQANLAEGAGLQIICCDGFIIIMRDTAMSAEELEDICSALRTADEVVQQLPSELDISEIEQKLREAVELAAERSNDE